jgi:hypothetical protein
MEEKIGGGGVDDGPVDEERVCGCGCGGQAHTGKRLVVAAKASSMVAVPSRDALLRSFRSTVAFVLSSRGGLVALCSRCESPARLFVLKVWSSLPRGESVVEVLGGGANTHFNPLSVTGALNWSQSDGRGTGVTRKTTESKSRTTPRSPVVLVFEEVGSGGLVVVATTTPHGDETDLRLRYPAAPMTFHSDFRHPPTVTATIDYLPTLCRHIYLNVAAVPVTDETLKTG